MSTIIVYIEESKCPPDAGITPDIVTSWWPSVSDFLAPVPSIMKKNE
tara:strand:- start:212 stop:352 length:141 start_codon:yes stop_codon:yes gene_type:complete